MLSSVNDFAIVLTGANSSTRHTAALLINQALQDRGFTMVDVVDDHGEPIRLPEFVPSVLDTIRRDAPKFFETFVTVQEVKVRSYGEPYYDEVRKHV